MITIWKTKSAVAKKRSTERFQKIYSVGTWFVTTTISCRGFDKDMYENWQKWMKGLGDLSKNEKDTLCLFIRSHSRIWHRRTIIRRG